MKKYLNKKNIATLMTFSGLAIVSACGKPNDPTVVTQVPGAVTTGACIPLGSSTQIPFTATGMYYGTTTDYRVMAGINPYKQTVGTVTVGGVDPSAAYGTGYGQLRGQRVDGTGLNLNLTSVNGAAPGSSSTGPIPGFGTTSPTYYPQQVAPTGNANAVGVLQLSPFVQQYLLQLSANTNGLSGFPVLTNQYAYQYPNQQYPSQYPGVNPGVAGQGCVSGIAIDLQRPNSSSLYLYLGSVYIYLNGTQHGLQLDF